MTWRLILIPVVVVALYFLYTNGFMYTQAKTALTFTGDGGGRKDRMGFSFTRCSGWISRVLKVREDGIYHFTMDAQLTKGTVQFQVLDRKKLPILILTPEGCKGRVQLEKNGRYHVRMDFTGASGGCAVNWENA